MTGAEILRIIYDGALAAVAATGFAVISNPPKKAIAVCALLAAVGHAMRFYMLTHIGADIVTATVFSAFTMGMMSIFFAKMIHCPAEVFSFPSLLPMIPGMYAYKTFLSLMSFVRASDTRSMENIMVSIWYNGAITISVMFALVLGVSLPLFIFHRQSFLMTRIMHNRHRM